MGTSRDLVPKRPKSPSIAFYLLPVVAPRIGTFSLPIAVFLRTGGGSSGARGRRFESCRARFGKPCSGGVFCVRGAGSTWRVRARISKLPQRSAGRSSATGAVRRLTRRGDPRCGWPPAPAPKSGPATPAHRPPTARRPLGTRRRRTHARTAASVTARRLGLSAALRAAASRGSVTWMGSRKRRQDGSGRAATRSSDRRRRSCATGAPVGRP